MLVSDDIQALSTAVSGTVALPDSPEFAAETFAFNAATVHRPDVVLGAAERTGRRRRGEMGGRTQAPGGGPVHRARR